MPVRALVYACGEGVLGSVAVVRSYRISVNDHDQVFDRPDDTIMTDLADRATITEEWLSKYLAGKHRAVVMLLDLPRPFERVVTLPLLRELLERPRWNPPREWIYLTDAQAQAIEAAGMGNCGVASRSL